MEYTKDVVFNLRYDEVNRVISFKKKNWTNYLWSKLKKHKLITISILLSLIFMIIDGILIVNFVNILEML